MENQLYGHLIFYLLGVNYRRISTGDCSLFSVKSLPVSFISMCSLAGVPLCGLSLLIFVLLSALLVHTVNFLSRND